MAKDKKADPAKYKALFDYAPDTHTVLLDLAHWERNVDFEALAEDGVKAIVLKGPAGVGWDDVDQASYRRAPRVLAAGLALSFYQFNYPSPQDGDASREAEFFFDFLRKISKVCGVAKAWHFSPWADLEVNQHDFSPRRLTDWILEFDGRFLELAGEPATLYCFKSYLDHELIAEDLHHMPLAVARYPGTIRPGMKVGGKADAWNNGKGPDAIQWTSSCGAPAVNGGKDAFDGCVARLDSPVFAGLFGSPLTPPTCQPSDDTAAMIRAVEELDGAIANLAAARAGLLKAIAD